MKCSDSCVTKTEVASRVLLDQSFEFLDGVVLVVDGFENLPRFLVISFVELDPGVEKMDVPRIGIPLEQFLCLLLRFLEPPLIDEQVTFGDLCLQVGAGGSIEDGDQDQHSAYHQDVF